MSSLFKKHIMFVMTLFVAMIVSSQVMQTKAQQASDDSRALSAGLNTPEFLKRVDDAANALAASQGGRLTDEQAMAIFESEVQKYVDELKQHAQKTK